MSFDGLLINTCSILSNDSDTADAYGQKARPVPSWDVVASNVPCRIDTQSVDRETEEKSETEEQINYRRVYMRNPMLSNGQSLNRHHALLLNGHYYNVRDAVQEYDSTSLHHLEVIVEEIVG